MRPKISNKLKIFSSITLVLSSTLLIIFIRTNKKVLIKNFQQIIFLETKGASSLNNLYKDKNSNRVKKLFEVIKLIYNSKLKNNKDTKNINKAINKISTMDIKMKYKDTYKIFKDREKAIKNGFLDEPTWANSIIKYENNHLNSRIRLKGNLSDHWISPKQLSFRFKLRKNKYAPYSKNYIYGHKTFSIHKLSSRQYPFSYIFQDTLKDLGMPYKSHKIVKVKFNNIDWGLMDMEDHYDKYFQERNKLKDSILFRFSDDNYWLKYYKNKSPNKPLSMSEYWLSHPKIFFSLSGNGIDNLSEVQRNHYYYISNEINQQDFQELLFNKDKLLKLDTILSIWGNYHAFTLENTRYYFNPYTLKLEPILSDQAEFKEYSAETESYGMYGTTNGFIKIQNSDKNIKENLFLFEKHIKNNIEKYNSNPLFPYDKKISNNIIDNNIYKLLNKSLTIDKRNKYKQDLYTNYLACEKSYPNVPQNFPLIKSRINNNTLEIFKLLCGKYFFNEITFCDIKYPLNKYVNPKSILIDKPYKINLEDVRFKNYPRVKDCDKSGVLSFSYNYGKERYSDIEEIKKINRLNNPLISKKIPSSITQTGEQEYEFKKGNWEIKNPIKIKGNLNIKENTNLYFHENSYLIIEGGLLIEGNINKPNLISSKNKDKYWKGIYVYNENEKNYSKLENTIIENVKETEDGILSLSGGINFYNTNLEINNFKINNSIAEDSLNIVKSNIKLNNIKINNAKSDGLDCDFCNGQIKNIYLYDIDGDGIDTSGSDLKIDILEAENIKDKVLSIGESSNVNAKIKNVFKSLTTAVIKDGSNAKLEIQNIENYGPILMVYDKKGFYNLETKGSVIYKDIKKSEKTKIINDFGTQLFINNELNNPTRIDIKSLYSQN